jgi:hypothetical protein
VEKFTSIVGVVNGAVCKLYQTAIASQAIDIKLGCMQCLSHDESYGLFWGPHQSGIQIDVTRPRRVCMPQLISLR